MTFIKPTKENIYTVLKSPVPIAYLVKNNMVCGVCHSRPKSYEEAMELQEVGVCRKCLTEDHVRGDL